MPRKIAPKWVGPGHEREPLGHYLMILGAFTAVVGTAITVAVRRGRAPSKIPVTDLALLGLATARVSRLIAREKATRVIRAPFTRVARGARRSEVREQPRPETPAMGELVLCPRCVGVWIGAGLGLAYAWTPEATRLVATMLSASLVSDVTNAAWARLTADAASARRKPKRETSVRPARSMRRERGPEAVA